MVLSIYYNSCDACSTDQEIWSKNLKSTSIMYVCMYDSI